jgi:integrase/recombinase XerC
MTSEITNHGAAQDAGSASEITNKITKRGAGARPTSLPTDLTESISEYAAALADAPLSPESRRTYLSRVRMYLAWLDQHNPQRTQGDPITNPRARDWAVRDYRLWLLRDGPDKRSVVYANSALTAIDDFYTRRGLGKVAIERDELPDTAPRALEEQDRIRWLRAVEVDR